MIELLDNKLNIQNMNNRGIVIALGFFDSVHIGHLELIKEVKRKARLLNCATCIATFSNNPYILLSKADNLVFSFDERLSIFNYLGLDYCLPLIFDEELRNVSERDFINSIFKFNVLGIVCGKDYRYGKEGKGDINTLKKECEERNIKLSIMDSVIDDGIKVSTTRIRQLLQDGNVEKANKLLSREYFIDGTVVNGKQIGRVFGIPTANLLPSADKLILKNGVYGTTSIINGIEYKSITNVGEKPTFNDSAFTIESLIKDFNDDIYGKSIRVIFIKRIRDTKKFDSGELLAKQLKLDMQW